MSKDLKKGKSKKGNENINDSNSIEKLNENKPKKKPIAIISGEDEDLKEDQKDEERNNRYKTDGRGDKYRPNMRRVDKVKIMVRKETAKGPKPKTDEDKSKKKEIKKEESVSSWSVESVEVIKENGVYKKEDKDLQDKIKVRVMMTMKTIKITIKIKTRIKIKIKTRIRIKIRIKIKIRKKIKTKIKIMMKMIIIKIKSIKKVIKKEKK